MNPPIAATTGSAAFEGLPPKFVDALRTLFDILDDQKTGFVKFKDIESRWKDEDTSVSSGLPVGVVDSLAKVGSPRQDFGFL